MTEDVRFSDTILGGIVKDATINWDYSDRTHEEKVEAAQKKIEEISELSTVEERVAIAKKTVGISVEDGIKGIAEVAGLTEEEKQQLETDINTKGEISPELTQKIKQAFEEKGKESSIIDVLSTIHDGWVRDTEIDPETNEIIYKNGKKFEDPARMHKLYQFTPLKLLDFKEATLDLLFLKPILEKMGIEVNNAELEQVFLREQKAFLDAHGIKDKESLKAKLQEAAAFYPALEGIKGVSGDLITDRLIAPNFSIDLMVDSVAEKALIPEKSKAIVGLDQIEEVAEELPKSKVLETTQDIKNGEEKPENGTKVVDEQGE